MTECESKVGVRLEAAINAVCKAGARPRVQKRLGQRQEAERQLRWQWQWQPVGGVLLLQQLKLDLCQRECGRLSTSVISSMASYIPFALFSVWFTVCLCHQSLAPRHGFCKQALLRPIGRPNPKTNDGDNLPHQVCYWLPLRPMDCFTFQG